MTSSDDDLDEPVRRLVAAVLVLAVLEARAGNEQAARWLCSPWARRLCDGLRDVDPDLLQAWRCGRMSEPTRAQLIRKRLDRRNYRYHERERRSRGY